MDATVDRRRRSALLHRGRVTGEGHPLRPPHVRAPQTLGHLWWRGRLLPQHIPDSSVQLGHRRRHLNPATGACRLMPTTHTQVGWLRWCRACSAWVGGTPAGCRSETARALASNPTIPTHISSQKSRRDGHFCCSRNRYLSDEGGGLRPALLQALAPITLGHQRPSVSDTASSPPALTPLLVQLQSSSSNPTRLSLVRARAPWGRLPQCTPIFTLVGLRQGAGPKRPAPSPLTQPFPLTSPARSQGEIGIE